MEEKRLKGLSLESQQRNIFLKIVRVKKLHNVPMTFHQRLLQNWQKLCDIIQLQLIHWVRLTPKLSTFQAVKHPSLAAEFHGAPRVCLPPESILALRIPPWDCINTSLVCAAIQEALFPHLAPSNTCREGNRLPGGPVAKNLPASAGGAGDVSSIPGEGDGHPLSVRA